MKHVKLSTDKRLQLIAVAIAIGVITIANKVLSFVCDSSFGGLIGALIIGAGAFAYVCSRGLGSALEHFHPPAVLFRLTPIKALGTIKSVLNAKYFDEKHWRLDNIDADEGQALFICKYVDKPSEKIVLERIILLKVHVERIADAVSVRFVYEAPSIGSLEKTQPAEFCRETTAFLELQLANAEMVLDNAA